MLGPLFSGEISLFMLINKLAQRRESAYQANCSLMPLCNAYTRLPEISNSLSYVFYFSLTFHILSGTSFSAGNRKHRTALIEDPE